MRHWYRTCPVCNEGRLFVRKAVETGNLYLLCEECSCLFSRPADTSDPQKALEGMESQGDFASSDDIASGGWSQYRMEVAREARRILIVTERVIVSKGMQADLARAAEGALLLLPHVHLVPTVPPEQEIQCGPLQVELRTPDKRTARVAGRVLETYLPFHVHCRVLVVDARPKEVPDGTEVWLAG